MKKYTLICLLGLLLFGTVGCGSLNSMQRAEYDMMRASGYDVKEKSVGGAAALGILPGIGSFYTRDPGMGVLDLLLWPYSILWDPINASQNAQVINYNATKAFVRKKKAKEETELEMQLQEQAITNEEYMRKLRAIRKKYNFDPTDIG